jgi:polysaccharide export outer membrane protein
MQPVRLGAVAPCFLTALLGAVSLLWPCPAPAQTIVETPQQANDRIRELSSSAHVIPHDYIIGNGDVLDIQIFDVQELSREVRVSQTGSIAIPLVPVRLRVAGLTESQAEQKITEVLEANGLVSHPQVSISVKERRSKPITVVGAVMHPLVYQADHPVSVLEVLAEAGGISNDAGDTVIVTRPVVSNFSEVAVSPESSGEPPAIGPEEAPPAARPKEAGQPAASTAAPGTAPAGSAPDATLAAPQTPGTLKDPGSLGSFPETAEPPRPSNTITINLNELVESGNTANNILLQAGDIVTVPHAGIVYVLGAVAKPGGFVLANDRSLMTTLKVLSLAGGLSNTAKSDHAVIIRRDLKGQQHEVEIDLKKVQKRETEDVQLLPSDILYVPTSGSKQALIRAVEFGLVLGSGVALYRLAYR